MRMRKVKPLIPPVIEVRASGFILENLKLRKEQFDEIAACCRSRREFQATCASAAEVVPTAMKAEEVLDGLRLSAWMTCVTVVLVVALTVWACLA